MINKYKQRSELEKLADDYFKIDKKLKDYKNKYGIDDWFKGYVDKYVDKWNDQVQRGKLE